MIFTTSELLKEKKKNIPEILEDVCVDSTWIFDYKIVIPSRESFVFLKNNNSNPPLKKKIILQIKIHARVFCTLFVRISYQQSCHTRYLWKWYQIVPPSKIPPYQNYFSLKKNDKSFVKLYQKIMPKFNVFKQATFNNLLLRSDK